MNRRDFVACALGSSGLWGLKTNLAAADSRSAKRLRILILGGTGNIGPYHVEAAVSRGHQVSVFSRGRTVADLPKGVERLIGDRNGDLSALQHRAWDAIIDIATFGPGWVRSLGEALRGSAAHYTFISTISVYDRPEKNPMTLETSPVLLYRGSEDPYRPIPSEGPEYGELKVLCEQEAQRQFPGRALVVRPGYIGGPGDTHAALPYWPLRMEHGGEVLAVGDQATPVQYIDVRDMAEWIVRMAEKRGTGTYNAVGSPIGVGDVVRAARGAVSSKSDVTWVPLSWLGKQPGRQAFGTLSFWEFNKGHLTRIGNARALSQGLTTRPLQTTLSDTLTWYRTQRMPDEVNTGPRPKPDGSGFESGHLPWPDYLAREKAVLTAWHARAARAAPLARSSSDPGRGRI